MSEPSQWAALREPFPPEHVQTRPGGGGQLSYVSHGHVTDRLLAVDPEYTFEPLLNEHGQPIVVLDGLAPGDKVGVWAELYVLGTSVVEFCSGKDLMDAYSRCLCRAAMRRGVALDLWTGDIPVGEVRKEGIGPAPVFRSWTKIREWYEKHGGDGAFDLYELFLKAASYFQYGEVESAKLSKDQRAVMLQKAAGATAFLIEDESQPLGPTPSVDLYRKAWASVLSGHALEIPEWKPPAVTQGPLVGDEAEAIADEVFEVPQ